MSQALNVMLTVTIPLIFLFVKQKNRDQWHLAAETIIWNKKELVALRKSKWFLGSSLACLSS